MGVRKKGAGVLLALPIVAVAGQVITTRNPGMLVHATRWHVLAAELGGCQCVPTTTEVSNDPHSSCRVCAPASRPAGPCLLTISHAKPNPKADAEQGLRIKQGL